MSAPDVERLVAERKPSVRDRAIWRTALTLAHNMCVQDSDRINDEDGSLEVVHALSDEAKRIRGWLEPTDAQLTEMFSEADVPRISSQPDPLPVSADIAGKLARALRRHIDATLAFDVERAMYDANKTEEGARNVSEASCRIADALDEAEQALAAYRAIPSGWIPVGERLPDYVIIGHGESYDTKFATEETLLDVLAGLIYYDPKEMPDEERAEWAARLADDDEWMSDPDIGRTKFTCGLGETDHIEIFRIVKSLPPPPQEGHSGRIYTAPEEVEAAQQHMREGKA